MKVKVWIEERLMVQVEEELIVTSPVGERVLYEKEVKE